MNKMLKFANGISGSSVIKCWWVILYKSVDYSREIECLCLILEMFLSTWLLQSQKWHKCKLYILQKTIFSHFSKLNWSK